jgi:hypothetical protein
VAGCDNYEMCKYLIEERGLIIDMSNSRASTPLIYATIRNSERVIRLLIEHNVDPRIRSGFSGMFPYEEAKNDIIMKMLLNHDKIVPVDYENNYILKDGYNLYQAYKYRFHRYLLSFVSTEFLKRNGVIPMKGMEIEDTQNITTQGFDKLLEQYKCARDDWLSSISSQCDTNACLYCNNKENLKRCSKCKSVYFCDKKCQKNASLLHKFDCKEKY